MKKNPQSTNKKKPSKFDPEGFFLKKKIITSVKATVNSLSYMTTLFGTDYKP
jgi:hypothetical protein